MSNDGMGRFLDRKYSFKIAVDSKIVVASIVICDVEAIAGCSELRGHDKAGIQ